MNILSKLLVTIAMIIGFILLFGIIVIQIQKTDNSLLMAIPVIAFFGLVAGIKAIWKKKKDADKHHLNKKR